jgi:uncharacterized protein YraI
MRPRLLLAAAALFGALALPTFTAAQTIAYAVPGTTNMRAGPGTQYPVIARIRGGSVVNVHGCVSDFSWCDASVQNVRGWVSTTRLEFDYSGRLVPLPRYYRYFGAPVILFDFGYWDRHYRDRPFYRHHRRDRRPDRPPHDDGGALPGHPGIFPEEGGQSDNSPVDFSPPPMIQGGGVDSGAGIFPEEGGGPPPPPIDEAPPASQDGFDAPPCPASNPNCR